MGRVTFREALRNALAHEMLKDNSVFIIGENVATWGGGWKVTLGLFKQFGERRVIETPVSENLIVAAALGASLAGLRPVAEIYSADFLFAAGSEVFNDIAKWRYQHRWKAPMHLVLRMPMGASGISAGPEHCQCPEGYLHHVPGLIVVAPSSVMDAAGSLRAAIRRGDPVIFLEQRRLYDFEGQVDSSIDSYVTEIGRAKVSRIGTGITIVAWAWMRRVSDEAAQILQKDKISVEIVDPITIKPLDSGLISESVKKTRRLLIVEESPRTGSVAAEIITTVTEQLSAISVGRLTMPNIPHPYHVKLEEATIPSVSAVVTKVREMVTYSSSLVKIGGKGGVPSGG